MGSTKCFGFPFFGGLGQKLTFGRNPEIWENVPKFCIKIIKNMKNK